MIGMGHLHSFSMMRAIKLLIAIIVLQFAGANLGGHQLHLGNSTEEKGNHAHVQFTPSIDIAALSQLAECIQCSCAADGAREHAPSDDHSHPAPTNKTIDLCLDCQCHGGLVAIVFPEELYTVDQANQQPLQIAQSYLAPALGATYRPPIV